MASLHQARGHQSLGVQGPQQPLILVLVKGQPEHRPVRARRQLIEGIKVRSPGRALQLSHRPPAEHDRPAPPLPGSRRQAPDRVAAHRSLDAPIGREAGRGRIPPADRVGQRQQAPHQQAAAASMQRPQALPP